MTNISRVNFAASQEVHPFAIKTSGPVNFSASLTPHPLLKTSGSVLDQGILGRGISTPAHIAKHAAPSPSLKLAPPSAQLTSTASHTDFSQSAREKNLAKEMTHPSFVPVNNMFTRVATQQVHGAAGLVRSLSDLPGKFMAAAKTVVAGEVDIHALNRDWRETNKANVQSVTPENLLAEVNGFLNKSWQQHAEAALGFVFAMTKGTKGPVDGLTKVLDDIAKPTNGKGQVLDGKIPKITELSGEQLATEIRRARTLRNHDKEKILNTEVSDRQLAANHQNHRDRHQITRQEVMAGQQVSLARLEDNLIRATKSGDARAIKVAEHQLADLKTIMRHTAVKQRFEDAIRGNGNGHVFGDGPGKGGD